LDALHKGLDSEKIKTLELALDQQIAKRFKFRINGFYNTIDDIITHRPATASELLIIDPSGAITSTLVYDNLGQQTIYGFEAEIFGYPTEKIHFWGNISYKEGQFKTTSPISGVDTTLNYIPFMEKITANIGATLRFGNFSISPYYQFVGKREGYLGNAVNNIQSVDSYGLINLNIIYKVSNNTLVSILGKNLTNETYYYPEEARREILTIPGGPGIGIFAKLTFKL